MAAPNSAYRIGTLPINLGATVLGQVLWALVQAGVSDTVIKERFYLDGFFSIGDGAAGNITVNNGFAGFCYVGSPNYYMHNLARISYVSGWHEGREIVIFNDAGLNTLGTAGLGTVHKNYANYILLDATFKASYYNSTTQIGVMYRRRGSATSFEDSLQTHFIPNQNELFTDRYLVSTGYQKDDELEMIAVNINEEGRYQFSAPIYIILDGPVFAYSADFRSAPCVAGAIVSIYMSESDRADLANLTENPIANPTIQLFKDPSMEIIADSGWYYGLDGGDVKSFFVNSNGYATHYADCGGGGIPQYDLTISASDSGLETWSLRFDLAQANSSPVVILGRFSQWVGGSELAGGYAINVTIPIGSVSAFRDSMRPYNPSEDWRFTITSITPSLSYITQV